MIDIGGYLTELEYTPLLEHSMSDISRTSKRRVLVFSGLENDRIVEVIIPCFIGNGAELTEICYSLLMPI
jgi:hypothetical protein